MDRLLKNVLTLFLLVFIAINISASSSPPKKYDLLIKNGKVINGTGNPWFYADIGIQAGKITAIGDLSKAEAEKTLNAKNLIVCPGFIDMHTHCDSELGDPCCQANLNYLAQGVTTVVTGNCGESVSIDVLNTKQKWEKQGIGTNVVYLVGHGSIRREVMGNAPRKATPEEIEKMKSLARKAMEEGAWGMSTGLEYIPGRFADTQEVIEIIRIVAEYKGIHTTHMRDEAGRIIEAIKEIIRLTEETKVRSIISHLKVTGKNNWGLMKKAVQTIEDARSRGIYITADQYPYIKSAPIGLLSTFLEIPKDMQLLSKLRAQVYRSQWQEKDREKALAAYHRELIKTLKDKEKRNMIKQLTVKGRPNDPSAVAMWGWHDFTILVAPKNKHLEGKNFIDIARELDRDMFDILVNLVIDEPDILYGGGSQSEKDHNYALTQSWVMVSSDGSALPVIKESAKPVRGHPREFGSQTKILRKYVREKKLLSLEDAIRKMTSLPASVLQMKKRGMLLQGYTADLVIFDPETVRDNSTYSDSFKYPSGVEYVIIDGQISIKKGEYKGALYGKVLLLN